MTGGRLDAPTRIRSWSRQGFLRFTRTGVRPDGRQVDPKSMPWPVLDSTTEQEREALWLFLRSLAAMPTEWSP